MPDAGEEVTLVMASMSCARCLRIYRSPYPLARPSPTAGGTFWDSGLNVFEGSYQRQNGTREPAGVSSIHRGSESTEVDAAMMGYIALYHL
jgi:hypothetical protein